MNLLSLERAQPDIGEEQLAERTRTLSPIALLLAPVVLPASFYYFGAASSVALGTSGAAVLALGFVAWRTPRKPPAVAAPALAGPVLLMLLTLAAHGLVASLLQPLDFPRAAASTAPLLLIVVGGHAMARVLGRAPADAVDRAARVVLAVLCVVAVLGIAGLAPPSAHLGPKPVFPFTEPSHFAISFVPFLLYRCATSPLPARIAWLLVGIVVALALENLTLVVGCLLVAAIVLRYRTLLALVAAAALALTTELTLFDQSYYAERLDFSEEGRNLSSLVYVQGWEMLVESLRNSDGWGLGFQQLGLRGTEAPASELIAAIHGEDLNLLDGGFTTVKLVSEFGMLGILLLSLYLLVATRAALALRRGGAAPAVTLARCAVVAYAIELFVRGGGGYFSGTGLLLVTSLWLLAGRAPGHGSSPDDLGDASESHLDAAKDCHGG